MTTFTPGALRSLVHKVGHALAFPRDNPELVQAKMTAFSRQVPLMYSLLMANTLALSITHYSTAPLYMTVYLPAVLQVACLIRLVTWWRRGDVRFTPDEAIRRLRGVVVFAVVLGIGFTSWSLSLFQYGDAYAKSHVPFFMAVTVIGCGFCLMHVRVAAIAVMLLVAVPFAIFFGSTGNAVLVSIAINFAMVTFALVVMILVNFQDFEKRVNAEQVLRLKQAELQAMSDTNFENSHIDSLTGLPNRRYFFAELEQRIETAAASGASFAIGILDLDGFKPVNDVHGHRTGDQLLNEAGQRLRKLLPPSTFLARIGGDEFVLISESASSDPAVITASVVRAGEQVSDIFNTPFDIDKRTIRVGCSIGVAIYPSAATTAEDLFECADYALYFVKQNNRGSAMLFSAEHEASIRRASLIDQALLNADLERELWVAFQPIVDTDAGRPVSFEALARWNSAALGDVSPMVFITAAERSGAICLLTPILLRKALEAASCWPDDLRISFNLSAVDIASPLSINRIVNIVDRSGFDPSRIDFEITETTVMRNRAQATEALDALKALGARISLDDFGTGYSSLSCIRELPLDKVKIDRSFILNVESDPGSRMILRTVVELCAKLGLDSLVEGVETAEQLQLLRNEGCRFMQGFYFAKPMPGERVLDYMASCRRAPAMAAGRA